MPKKTSVNPYFVDVNERRSMIAEEAYYIAERRGFGSEGESGDWLAAEAIVDERLTARAATGARAGESAAPATAASEKKARAVNEKPKKPAGASKRAVKPGSLAG